jgi:hypothetical protein
MSYEEKVINGVLCARSSPTGEWSPATTKHAQAVNALLQLTDDQRLEAFAYFCKYCGRDDPSCQCWNDD